MTANRFEHADRNVPRAGLSVVKCPLHPGSVDVHHPAGDEQIMHVSAALWAAFIDWVKAGLGDYDQPPGRPPETLTEIPWLAPDKSRSDREVLLVPDFGAG